MAKKKTSAKRSAVKRSAAKPKSAKKAVPAKKSAAKKPAVKAKKVVKKATGKAVKAAPKVAKRPAPPAKKAIKKSVAKPTAKVPVAKVPTKPTAKPVASKAPAPSAKKPVATAPTPKVVVPKAAPTPARAPERKAPPPAPVAKAAPAPKAEKRSLKERVIMEFEVRSAPNVLFDLISTPSGFSEWYCDDVDVRGDQYTFKWGSDEEAATMIGRKAPEVIRFHRNDDQDEASFYEFRIRIDAMTNEVALIVTDHAWPNEVEETRSLWASQVASLLRVLGA